MPGQDAKSRSYEVMLALAAGLYLSWWFAVEEILPHAFNPLRGRLVVVGYFVAALLLARLLPSLRRRADQLYAAGAFLLTAHYFYLVERNASDLNWMVGAYLVVLVVYISMPSRRWLIAYSVLSLLIGVVVWLLAPPLRTTIFLPGLLTIVAVCVTVLLGRIRLLENLAESTSRFQSLFDAAFDGVMLHDEGVVVDVNEALAKLFGYSRAQMIGMKASQLVAPEDWPRMSERLTGDQPQRYETVVLRRDGTTLPIEVSSKVHFVGGRKVRLAAVRDLTDTKRAESERLELMREQAARLAAQGAVRIRDEFMAIASHELRTPVTSLQLQQEGLMRALRKLPLTEAAAIQLSTYEARSARQMDRLKRLLQQLLDVSRMTEGGLTLEPEPLDLAAVVHGAVDGLREDLDQAGCTVEIREPSPIRGVWDRLRLEQLFTNLLRNALLYGRGKPIEVGLSSDGERASILVRDQGIGIEKESQQKIFERFERAVSARNYGGLGLGLYISRQIVEAHQGAIRVDSEPGQGATFWVELPLGSP